LLTTLSYYDHPIKNRTLDDILLDYEKQKRKFLKRKRSKFVLSTVTEVEEILRLDQEMLRPVASARYGTHAYQLPTSELIDMSWNPESFTCCFMKGKKLPVKLAACLSEIKRPTGSLCVQDFQSISTATTSDTAKQTL